MNRYNWKPTPPKGWVLAVDPFTEQQLEKIRVRLKRKNDLRLLCIINLAANSGFRMVDVLSLKVGQVRKLSVGDQLKVKETKTGKSNTFHFNGLMIDSLKAYLKDSKPEGLRLAVPIEAQKRSSSDF